MTPNQLEAFAGFHVICRGCPREWQEVRELPLALKASSKIRKILQTTLHSNKHINNPVLNHFLCLCARLPVRSWSLFHFSFVQPHKYVRFGLQALDQLLLTGWEYWRGRNHSRQFPFLWALAHSCRYCVWYLSQNAGLWQNAETQYLGGKVLPREIQLHPYRCLCQAPALLSQWERACWFWWAVCHVPSLMLHGTACPYPALVWSAVCSASWSLGGGGEIQEKSYCLHLEKPRTEQSCNSPACRSAQIRRLLAFK